jgi:single-strand DNA-binding protein
MDALTTVTGNLGKDVELKFSKDGLAIASFSIGHTPSTMRNGVREDGETMWIRVTLFGDKAETAVDRLKKGDAVLVTGKLKQSTYMGKDLIEKTSLEIIASEVGILIKGAPRARQVQQDSAPW